MIEYTPEGLEELEHQKDAYPSAGPVKITGADGSVVVEPAIGGGDEPYSFDALPDD